MIRNNDITIGIVLFLIAALSCVIILSAYSCSHLPERESPGGPALPCIGYQLGPDEYIGELYSYGKAIGMSGNKYWAYVESRKEGAPYSKLIVDGRIIHAWNILPGRYNYLYRQNGHFAFKIQKDGYEFCVHDGRTIGPFENIEYMRLSPDGTRIAIVSGYAAGKYVSAGGGKYGPYQGLDHPAFSADSKRLFFIYRQNGKYFTYDDGRYHGPYEGASYPEYGDPYGKKSDTLLFTFNNSYIYLGGRVIGPFKGINRDYIRRSDDGKGILFSYSVEDRYDSPRYMFHNGRTFGPFDQIDKYVISPDGRHIALSYKKNKTEDVYHVARDGSETGPFSYVYGLHFSPDSMRFAYGYKSGEKCFISVDDRIYGPYQMIDYRFHFSPDSKHFAFRFDYRAVNKDGTALGLFGGLFEYQDGAFTPDSRQFIFPGISSGSELPFLYLNGREFQMPGWNGCDHPTSMYSLREDGKKVYYVKIEDRVISRETIDLQ